MIRELSRYSRRALNPTIAAFGNPELAAQTVVHIAEVIKRADDEHTSSQGFGLASQCNRCRKVAFTQLSRLGNFANESFFIQFYPFHD